MRSLQDRLDDLGMLQSSNMEMERDIEEYDVEDYLSAKPQCTSFSSPTCFVQDKICMTI